MRTKRRERICTCKPEHRVIFNSSNKIGILIPQRNDVINIISVYASEPPLRICVKRMLFILSCQNGLSGLNQFLAGVNVSCSITQHSAADEAHARSLSISNQALLIHPLSHCQECAQNLRISFKIS